MSYDIGTARGVIEMEYNGRGIDQAKEELSGLEKSGKSAMDVVGDSGKVAGRAGLAIAAGLGLAVNTAANFEQRLSAVKAVSGATSSEMDKLRDKAMQLGADTAFSASESASAMEELVKAGLSVTDVLNGAADATVALAAAGEVDMVTAATIASNAMNQFGLKAEDMVGVVDNIAGAANASAIDVTDFGMSLSQVGAMANLTGTSFEDTATAIAIMGNAGIKGSDAGTSLKTMLANLQPTTKKQIDTFKELGIITDEAGNRFFDAKGNIKDFASVAGILNGATKGLSKQQKTMALEVMFGSDAIRAAAVIADNGSKGFNKMNDAMGKTSAAEVAATRMDNFKGTLEEFKGSMETAAISVGTVFLPVLRKIVDQLTVLANKFNSLSPGMQKFIGISIAVVAALLLTFAAVVKIIIVAGRLTAALSILKIALAKTWLAALGPVALVIAAILAIVAVFTILWKNSETFRNFFIGLWNGIKSAASAVGNWFTGPFLSFFKSAWADLKSSLTAIKDFFTSVWNGIKSGVSIAFAAIGAVIGAYINIWKTIITTALGVISAVWTAFWGVFGGVIKAAFGLIVAIFRLGWTIVKGIFLLYMQGILIIVRTVWNAIVAVLRAVWGTIKDVITTGANAIRAVVTAVWNAIKATSSAVWNSIKAVIAAVWGAIGGTVMSAVNRVKSVVSGAWNAVKSVTTSVWNAVKSAVGNAVDGIMGIVGGIQDRIIGFFSGAASWLTGAGRAIIQGLIDGITSMISNVTSVINSVTDKVAKFLPGSPVREGPLKVLNRGHAGKEIIEMMITGIGAMADPLARAMNDAVEPAMPTGFATPASPTGRVRRGHKPSGDRRRERLIDGELRLDRSGRAFISGVAVDADEDDDDYDDTLRRMGRG